MIRVISTALLLTVMPAIAACSRESSRSTPPAPSGVARPDTPPVAPPLIATQSGWRLPAAAPQAGWHPTRDAVAIAEVAHGAFEVAYTRDKGTASGAAFMLPPGSASSLKSIVIRASAEPAQRLHVCLTDSAGVVWTFPTIRVKEAVDTFTLAAADIGPDPYQNAGKTPPASPDWASMQMITILDISAHMGAPAVPCRWRIESVEGVVR